MADSQDLPRRPPQAGAELVSLTERVRERLDLAGIAYDRRATASLPRGRRRKTRPPTESGSTGPEQPELARERACLRTVFRELGVAHRYYRRDTGRPVSPALRAATTAFKQAPSLVSLVPVVACLDELGLLAW